MAVSRNTVAFIETQAQANAAFAKIRKNLRLIMEDTVKTAGKVAVTILTDEIFRLSQIEVPEDKGPLKDSGKKSIEVGNGEVVGTIGYGGPGRIAASGKVIDVTYATLVHEGVGQGKNTERNMKFLERPGNAVAGNVKQLLEGKLKLK